VPGLVFVWPCKLPHHISTLQPSEVVLREALAGEFLPLGIREAKCNPAVGDLGRLAGMPRGFVWCPCIRGSACGRLNDRGRDPSHECIGFILSTSIGVAAGILNGSGIGRRKGHRR
jgi:hypothetical protein